MAASKTTFPKGNGPGKGEGWGGPVRGELPRGEKAPDFQPGNRAAEGYTQDIRDNVRRSNEERAERLRDHLEHLAFCAESENTRTTATDKLLDRLEGKARQSVEVTNKDAEPLVKIYLPGNDRDGVAPAARSAGEVSIKLG